MIGQLIKFNRLVKIEVQMSLNLLRNREGSLQQSRVSSSSSNQSQGYELIPRQQPFANPSRDIASPKASFPFRKVQAASQYSFNNRLHKQNSNSIHSSAKGANDSRDIIEPNPQTNSSFQIINRKQQQSLAKSINHSQLQQTIEQLRRKIEQLQGRLEQQRNDYDLQRKANEIYTQGFQKIKSLILTKCKQLQGESIEEIVSKLGQLLQQNVGNDHYIIEEQDKKIRELRAQLLKSTQNNINAIFNTEITEAYCLQHQIQKMNLEIINLKEKLIKATEDNQENIAKMLQNKSNSSSEIKKIIKIYQQRLDSQSEGEQLANNKSRSKKTSNNKSQRKLRQRRQSSQSQKSGRNKRLKSTQNKISDLIDGYKVLRGQYSKLQDALKQINGSQNDFKQLFLVIKKDMTNSIQTQLKQVKQTIKRPSSNHQQLKIAKEIQSKLNDLVNTLNAPQKVNIQRQIQEQEVNNWKSVQMISKISDLQSKNTKLEMLLVQLNEEKNHLQQTIMNMSKFYLNKQGNQLYVDSAQKIKRSSKKGEQIDQFILTSKSDVKEQHIHEQLSAGSVSGHIVHTSGFNKLHSSQSYHQSSSKNTEIQSLYLKIQRYQEVLRQKQLRITQLENTILDHIQSRTDHEPHHHSQKEIRERYENYINNLKMLLNQSRKQYQILKKQLIKSNQMSLSRANNDHDRNSITLSDRTTKNCIAQTRLIQRRPPKTNSFESIRAKLQIEEALEKAFISLIQFTQKIILYQDVSRVTVIDGSINCVKQLILEAKQRNCKLYEDTMNHEDVRLRLNNIGIQLN